MAGSDGGIGKALRVRFDEGDFEDVEIREKNGEDEENR